MDVENGAVAPTDSKERPLRAPNARSGEMRYLIRLFENQFSQEVVS